MLTINNLKLEEKWESIRTSVYDSDAVRKVKVIIDVTERKEMLGSIFETKGTIVLPARLAEEADELFSKIKVYIESKDK